MTNTTRARASLKRTNEPIGAYTTAGQSLAAVAILARIAEVEAELAERKAQNDAKPKSSPRMIKFFAHEDGGPAQFFAWEYDEDREECHTCGRTFPGDGIFCSSHDRLAIGADLFEGGISLEDIPDEDIREGWRIAAQLQARSEATATWS